MVEGESRPVDPELEMPEDSSDPKVKAALETYTRIQKEFTAFFEPVVRDPGLYKGSSSTDPFESAIFQELSDQYDEFKENSSKSSWWYEIPKPVTFKKLMSNPPLKYYFWCQLIKAKEEGKSETGVIFDVDEYEKNLVFPGDLYYSKKTGKLETFVDRREAQRKALEWVKPIPSDVATITEQGVFACARQEVIDGLRTAKEKAKEAIPITSAFRPLGETARGKYTDPHGVVDTTDPVGHWTGWAIDVHDSDTYKEYLKGADFEANLGGEPWHWTPLKRYSSQYINGALLSEKGFKRARATMSNVLGSPAGDGGHTLGFLAGGLGGSGSGSAAALAGTLSRRGSGTGGPAAAGGPGEGVNFKQYIDKVNVTSYGGFSTDALMAALEEAAQQGTAKVG